jgi:hypothetical protein
MVLNATLKQYFSYMAAVSLSPRSYFGRYGIVHNKFDINSGLKYFRLPFIYSVLVKLQLPNVSLLIGCLTSSDAYPMHIHEVEEVQITISENNQQENSTELNMFEHIFRKKAYNEINVFFVVVETQSSNSKRRSDTETR